MSAPQHTPGPQNGNPPTLEWVALDRLHIDPAYQRATDGSQSRRIIAGMVKAWEWSLCQPLVVSRRTDGSLYILDGQHRHTGAKARGDIPHLPCVLLSGASPVDEADTFLALNTRRQRLSQADIFNGMLAAGDPDAVAMAEVLAATGWRQVRSSGTDHYQPGDLGCAPMLVKSAKAHGIAVVRNALCALREAYPETPVRHASTILKALFVIYRDGQLDGGDPDAFIEALGSVDPQDWGDFEREQRRISPTLSHVDGMAAAIMAAYRDYVREEAA